jgi:hypothetical protein
MKKSERKAFEAELEHQQLFKRKYQLVLDSPHSGAEGHAYAQQMVAQADDNIDTMLAWAALQ